MLYLAAFCGGVLAVMLGVVFAAKLYERSLELKLRSFFMPQGQDKDGQPLPSTFVMYANSLADLFATKLMGQLSSALMQVQAQMGKAEGSLERAAADGAIASNPLLSIAASFLGKKKSRGILAQLAAIPLGKLTQGNSSNGNNSPVKFKL